MSEPVDDRTQLRRNIYCLLILLSAGMMLGRIFAVDSVDRQGLEKTKLQRIVGDLAEKRISLEAAGMSGKALQEELDRTENQWRAKAALRRPFLSANDRSRWCTVRALVEEDMRVPGHPYAIDNVIRQPNWDTIDMVKCGEHLYSSKPPLMSTLMAAVYWPIYRITGATLGTHPYEIGRAMLVLFNLVPLVIGLLLLARLVERFGTTDWGRIFVVASAAFGTFLTTFAVVINNHLPAAVCVIAATYAAVRIWCDGEQRWRYYFLAGLFGSLAVAFELPAASFFAPLALLLLWKSPRTTLVAFLPPVALVAAAFFGTNWIALHSLKPAYMHRTAHDGWYEFDYELNGRTVPSYWKNPVGVDRGEPSRGIYAMNVTVGHHGIFSLTPIWLLSLVGLGIWTFGRYDARLRWMAATTFAISVACLAFYLIQPEPNRNYGGVSSGLRWMFWLAPLWILAMTPTADAMAGRRWARAIGLALLTVSVLSASYPTWNPWTHPWLMVLSQYLGL